MQTEEHTNLFSSNVNDSINSIERTDELMNSDVLTGESLTLEYKLERSQDSKRYLKTVVAFANGVGGKLVFGVDDKSREPVGISETQIFSEIDAITNAISDGCEPIIRPEITIRVINEKQLIEVKINPGRQVPYYVKSLGIAKGTFVRVAATTRVAADYELQEMLLRGSSRSLDSQIVQGCILNHAEIDETCAALTAYAKERYKQRGINIAVRELTISQLLSWGIVIEQDGKLLPTYAYHLLAGKAIPNVISGIKCGVFKGSDRHFMVDNQLFDGPLIVQIENAYRYVLRMCRIGAEFSGVFRIDVPEFPMDTVRELLCNAVCHRSYLQPSNIQVALYDDRLEITSPGMLEPDLTIADIKVGRSKIRNMGITRVMQYLGLFEGWGRGIPDMLADCERYGLPEPSIESIANDFRVNIYRKDPIA